MTNMFDASAKPVHLGRKLGSGGEGDVYEVTASGHDLVAKIYHASPQPDKVAKLQGMVHGGDDCLKSIAAWPAAILHLGRNGPVRGFLMPKVTGYEPIHTLYSPAVAPH